MSFSICMEVKIMIFSEVYSAYYNAVAHLIDKAIDGELNEKTAFDIINDYAFSESFVFILDAIKNEEWQVITKDFNTPIKNKPSMPLTELQMRYLKAITLDKRFLLFSQHIEGLDNIEPLYTESDFYYFDINKDRDPYDSDEYISAFKTILCALKEKRQIEIEFKSSKGYYHHHIYTPRKLEYSPKDDKFRLICQGKYKLSTINIARIKGCVLLKNTFDESQIRGLHRQKCFVIFEITDKRNALERSMLHFANYEKETRQIDNDHYETKLTYYKSDETEVLIRILSFGPMIKVTYPESFIKKIKERLKNQKKLRTN